MEGRGILLSGVPGVPPANVVILGGGVVGANAAKIAAGFGANVYLLDVNLERLRYLDDVMPANVTTIFSNRLNIRNLLPSADLVIGGVLRRGAKAPVLVTQEMLKSMKRGSVVVDVAVDQGGCFETTRPTTHSQPTYIVEGVVHYCVANMPGAVAGTSTYALTNEDAALRPPACRQRLEAGDAREPAAPTRTQCGLWQGDVQRCRGAVRLRLHSCRAPARLIPAPNITLCKTRSGGFCPITARDAPTITRRRGHVRTDACEKLRSACRRETALSPALLRHLLRRWAASTGSGRACC